MLLLDWVVRVDYLRSNKWSVTEFIAETMDGLDEAGAFGIVF